MTLRWGLPGTPMYPRMAVQRTSSSVPTTCLRITRKAEGHGHATKHSPTLQKTPRRQPTPSHSLRKRHRAGQSQGPSVLQSRAALMFPGSRHKRARAQFSSSNASKRVTRSPFGDENKNNKRPPQSSKQIGLLKTIHIKKCPKSAGIGELT